MAIKIGDLGNKKLLADLIFPSWFSGFVAVVVSLLLVSLTVALTHFGDTVQQSLLGLQHVYAQSNLGTKVITVSDNFASNSYLNNVLLFLLWGSVGLMVYSVVQGFVVEIKRANSVLQQMNFVNADRQSVLREAAIRESIKVIGFVLWWALFRFAIFKLAPYTIAAAHTIAVHPAIASNWLHVLLAAAACVLALHVLAVLLRLTLLRARVFGADIAE